MRFVSWGIIAACGFLLAGPAAKAADLRVPDLPPASRSPSPSYDWTGFYAGVYGGGALAAWEADYCRGNACRHVVFADDFEPVDRRIAVEDFVVMLVAQAEPETEEGRLGRLGRAVREHC